MKKMIAAVAAGAMLVAAQAVAAESTAVARVGDRIGAPMGEASELAGGAPLAIIAAGGIVAAFVLITDNDEPRTDFPDSD